MKKIIYLLVAVLGVTSAFAQSTGPITFKETTHSFGKIKQGVPVTYAFTFKNTSDKPVVIENATAGCGCTTPVFPKGAIAAGASEKISVTFNAQTMNTFTKQVTVNLANVKDPIILTISGEVVDGAAAVNKDADKTSTAASKTKAKTTATKAKVKSKS
jgi:hypothetical protein